MTKEKGDTTRECVREREREMKETKKKQRTGKGKEKDEIKKITKNWKEVHDMKKKEGMRKGKEKGGQEEERTADDERARQFTMSDRVSETCCDYDYFSLGATVVEGRQGVMSERAKGEVRL